MSINRNADKKRTIAQQPRAIIKKLDKSQKLTDEMENDIKDAFQFFDTDKTGQINRAQLRSILGNFAFTNMTIKEIEEELRNEYSVSKNNFYLEEVIQIIIKKWFLYGGRDNEANEIFKLFDKRNKNIIGLPDIKYLFSQYLDINVNDSDIIEFIQEADLDQDGVLDKNEFCSKLGYF
ncbi:hypothetical protein IMG5_001350 [Ichthyophthirius multifiliis]|uniref:EF-hand domain-containing protein n=1 Tax=Ichthyophthirius multifiliis TaxID=5932 RepID=G0QIS7_ICHMU|nr:hypothetical protein IMG5_001350 [Ichthyophthirius multifiliis]EGR34906.1 hypothetical protein IMG5_001350 [Ichthyophthirius multifiliis]|eukprot:XP_004040210.1 hypothetical protein IMG5_001350 [Ichthyophthirius multifiliis]